MIFRGQPSIKFDGKKGFDTVRGLTGRSMFLLVIVFKKKRPAYGLPGV